MRDRVASDRRLLVISQRTDRTGAPVQLAVLLDGLQRESGMRITVLLGSSGVVSSVLASHATKVKREPRLLRLLSAAGRRAPRRLERLVLWVWEQSMRVFVGRQDLVYVNSLSSRRLAKPFVRLPALVHVHEIGTFAEASGEDGRHLLNRARLIAVPSQVAEDWVIGSGVEPGRVTRIPGSLTDSAFEAPEASEVESLALLLSIPPGALVVSSVGWIGEMKGSDRFLAVARRLMERMTDRQVRMLWVGGDVSTGAGARFAQEIEREGLGEVVTVAPGLTDLRLVYCLSTVVLIASREESLSLVALEAAAQRTPVVAFPGAGGPDELADEGVVLLAGGTEAEDMAALIAELCASPDAIAEQSGRAYRAVMDSHRRRNGQARLVEALHKVSEA